MSSISNNFFSHADFQMKFISKLSIIVSVLELAFELVIAILGHLNLNLNDYTRHGTILWWALCVFSFSLTLFDMVFTYKKNYILAIAIFRVIKIIGVIIVSVLYFHLINILDIQDWINRLRGVFKYLVNDNDKSDQQAYMYVWCARTYDEIFIRFSIHNCNFSISRKTILLMFKIIASLAISFSLIKSIIHFILYHISKRENQDQIHLESTDGEDFTLSELTSRNMAPSGRKICRMGKYEVWKIN